MAHLLGAEALQLEFPTKVVFDNVTLGLNDGDRVGVVGKNGDGKTSLLEMLAGRLLPDAGRVTVGRTVVRSHSRKVVAGQRVVIGNFSSARLR